MERQLHMHGENRRVFTEDPSNYEEQSDSEGGSSDHEIDPRQMQQLMLDPQFRAMFAKGFQ